MATNWIAVPWIYLLRRLPVEKKTRATSEPSQNKKTVANSKTSENKKTAANSDTVQNKKTEASSDKSQKKNVTEGPVDTNHETERPASQTCCKCKATKPTEEFVKGQRRLCKGCSKIYYQWNRFNKTRPKEENEDLKKMRADFFAQRWTSQ